MKLPDYAKAIGISYTTAWRTEKIIAELRDGGTECS